MGLADDAPEALVDLERYPVFDAGSAPYRAVVERARHELAAVGAAELPGFVGPAGVAALVAEAESLVARAHRSGGQGTAYLELSGVLGAVADGVVGGDLDDLLLVTAVWVDPEAQDERLVYDNNRAATRQALERGAAGAPALEDVLAVADRPGNPFLGLRFD